MSKGIPPMEDDKATIAAYEQYVTTLEGANKALRTENAALYATLERANAYIKALEPMARFVNAIGAAALQMTAEMGVDVAPMIPIEIHEFKADFKAD